MEITTIVNCNNIELQSDKMPIFVEDGIVKLPVTWDVVDTCRMIYEFVKSTNIGEVLCAKDERDCNVNDKLGINIYSLVDNNICNESIVYKTAKYCTSDDKNITSSIIVKCKVRMDK